MRKLIFGMIAAAGLVIGSAEAHEPFGRAAKALQEEEDKDKDKVSTESTLLNINNMAMWIKSDGASARNPKTGGAGVTFPRSTDQVIFADGLIWGGRVLDGNPQELRVGGQTYAIGTVPGVIESRGVAQDYQARLHVSTACASSECIC